MLIKKVKSIIGIILILVISVSIVACGEKSGEANVNKDQSQLDKIKDSGKIVLGTSADFPPYEFHKEVNGKDTIVGFDIEIAKEIAKDLSVELQIKDMQFKGLLAALNTGNVDLVIAGMTPDEDRKETTDFSKLYYITEQALVIRDEDANSIVSLQDLEGKKIGAQMGSTQETIASEQIDKANVKSLGKISDLILELKNDKTDALVVAKPVAEAYVSKNSDLFIPDIHFENIDEGSAIAFKKGSPDLVDAINKTLDRLIEDGSINKFVTEATESME